MRGAIEVLTRNGSRAERVGKNVLQAREGHMRATTYNKGNSSFAAQGALIILGVFMAMVLLAPAVVFAQIQLTGE